MPIRPCILESVKNSRLPMNMRFDFCDLIMLHKIIRGYMPISLPNYISFFTGKSRLRFCHLDRLSLVSSIIPRTCAGQGTTTNALANSFFYRSHLLWNKLPIEIRSIETISKFKVALEIHLFQKMFLKMYVTVPELSKIW